jgi:hypothetical protein
MRRLLTALAATVLPFTGCPIYDDGGVICTEIFVYGLNVTVTDAATGGVIEGATLTLTEGDFTETMMEVNPGDYVGAGERAGTYILTVEAEGYATQTVEDITIDADECHVIPVTENVALTSN